MATAMKVLRADGYTKQEAERLLKNGGFVVGIEAVDTIAEAYGTTREEIESGNADGIHVSHYAEGETYLICSFS